MWIKQVMERFLSRYGEEFACQRGERAIKSVRGIVTPVKDNTAAPQISAGARGISGGPKLEYLGEPGPAPGDVLSRGGRLYEVLRCEDARAGNETLYTRALLRGKEGAV